MTKTSHERNAGGSAGWLALDPAAESQRLQSWIRTSVRDLSRRGVVLGVSGGVDSAVCATLAAKALGPERVCALFTPGLGTSPDSARRARELCDQHGLLLREHSIVPTLRALGCYERRDTAIRTVFPDWDPSQRYKVVIAEGVLDRDRLNVFDLVVEAPDGEHRRARLPREAYLQLVASTNGKQRVRKLIEYEHADRLNFAVLGTPNRLEYELGFFVRGGDGLADLKPIAHLYKTQVYALADHLGVPRAIREVAPSTETYTLPQTQQEFFFALPLAQLDLLCCGIDRGMTDDAIAAALHLTPAQVELARSDILAKRRAASRLHGAALVTGAS
jgi:NAD+ synthase